MLTGPMNAGSDFPASEIIVGEQAEEEGVRVDQSELVVLAENLELCPADVVGLADRVSDQCAMLRSDSVSASIITGQSQASTLTMLDVAVAWRELPAKTSCKELELLRVLHTKAHGASCTCSAAKCKADFRWRTAIRPATRDRRPIGPENLKRWEQQMFDFDSLTSFPVAPPAGPATVITDEIEAVQVCLSGRGRYRCCADGTRTRNEIMTPVVVRTPSTGSAFVYGEELEHAVDDAEREETLRARVCYHVPSLVVSRSPELALPMLWSRALRGGMVCASAHVFLLVTMQYHVILHHMLLSLYAM